MLVVGKRHRWEKHEYGKHGGFHEDELCTERAEN